MQQKLARFVLLCGIVFGASTAQIGAVRAAPDQAKASDPWLPVRGLLGSWEGDAKGEPGTGKCEREYRLTLKDKFIQVTNKSTYPPQEKNPRGEVHEDIGFISYDKAARKLVLRQFHVEGFVNHYVLDSVSEDGRRVVFVTVAIENIPAGWRGRETYELVNHNEFVETFALAEPGKDFATYSETRFRRKRPPRVVLGAWLATRGRHDVRSGGPDRTGPDRVSSTRQSSSACADDDLTRLPRRRR